MSFGTVNGVPFGVGVSANSVGTAEIVDGQVMIADLADDSVTPAKLQDTGAFTVASIEGTSAVYSDGPFQLNSGGAFNADLAAANATMLRGGLAADATIRVQMDRNGKMEWGDGAVAPDTFLRRKSALTMELGTILEVTGNLYLTSGFGGSIIIDTAGGSMGWNGAAFQQVSSGVIGCNEFQIGAELTVLGNTKLGNEPTDTIGLYGETPVVQAAAIAAPTAPGVVYSQAEAQSMETAVNAIRVALAGIGVTA